MQLRDYYGRVASDFDTRSVRLRPTSRRFLFEWGVVF